RYTAEENIRTTILEVFGPHSPQYRDHQYHEIWQGGHQIPIGEVYPGDPEDVQRQTQFLAGIPQTIKMLEGLTAWLEEKRSELGHDTTTRIRAAFEDLNLHPRIADVCANLYRNGHYTDAVFNASKALVNFVKERSHRHDLDGAPLMRTVFS